MKRRGRPCKFPEPWLSLVNEAGGVGKLAESMGITPAQLRAKVRKGEIPVQP
jgi:tape measure domain-containing protein